MRRLLSLVAAAVLSVGLPACSGFGALDDGPSAIADATVADERAGIAIETLYTAAARAGALAYRAGVIEPSADPEVQTDAFCALVLGGSYQPSDRGGEVAALECRLRQARDLGRRAYDAGNSTGYAAALREATALGNQLLSLIAGDSP